MMNLGLFSFLNYYLSKMNIKHVILQIFMHFIRIILLHNRM